MARAELSRESSEAVRAWTQATTGKQLQGELVKVEGEGNQETITIRTDGRLTRIPLAVLTKNDQSFVEEWKAKQASNASLPEDWNRGKGPDFTAGEGIPAGATHDWNLGPTGARGWMFSHQLESADARQVRITKVEDGSPADGVLQVGDVIIGIAGKFFQGDPRVHFGKAITEAETEPGRGELWLLRWRGGQMENVVIKLPVLGSYSATAPWDCEKSRRILDQGITVLAEKIKDSSYDPIPITRSLNALALLAGGDSGHLRLLKREAKWAAEFSTNSFKTWHYGYVILFLSEYVMATGDQSVLPGLRRLALEAANGQSWVGSWGHDFAEETGRLAGYGMMNSPGVPLTISLVLARKAGVDDPAVSEAIEKSARLLRFYAGKGSIPYGDHRPWIENHDDNGKNGMAAVLFGLLGDGEAAEYFSHMSIACHGPERDTGHTGNFFNMVWAIPGVAKSGPHATGAWMNEFGASYLDFARQWNGAFIHQGPPELKGDSYKGWDCTGAWLLAYAIPEGTLSLTGRGEPLIPSIDATTAQSLIEDGRGWSNINRESFYDSLTTEQLMTRLSSWSPVVRERAGMALSRRQDDVIRDLISLLDSPELYARYGACQALKFQGGRGAKAVSALVEAFQADDLWLRVLAAEALASIGEPAKTAVPMMLSRLAGDATEDDPRKMEQRYLSFALFNEREGLIGRSLEGVDRELLFDAVRAGLQNEDGRSRSSFSSVYTNLSLKELEPLLPSIHRAIVEPAPSGIMFADGIRTSGLELFAKHHVSEGIELLADYARNQKKHASEHRIVTVMEMLEGYGMHAKRVIPQLEAVADYFEKEEEDFPEHLSLQKAEVVRGTMEKIDAATESPKLIYLDGMDR